MKIYPTLDNFSKSVTTHHGTGSSEGIFYKFQPLTSQDNIISKEFRSYLHFTEKFQGLEMNDEFDRFFVSSEGVFKKLNV